MNKSDYNKVIPQLPATSKKSGIYIISQEPIGTDMNKVITCKIGRSVDLKRRLNQYFLCYPTGYWIYALLYIHTKGITKNGMLMHNIDTETAIHNYFISQQLKTSSRLFNEWFSISYNDITKCLKFPKDNFDVVRPFRGPYALVDSFVDDISGEVIKPRELELEDDPLKGFLMDVDADNLSRLLADPADATALKEWSGDDIDNVLHKYLEDDKKEVQKVETKSEMKRKCSDCQLDKLESRFDQEGKTFKTCNACRLKRRKRKKNK